LGSISLLPLVDATVHIVAAMSEPSNNASLIAPEDAEISALYDVMKTWPLRPLIIAAISEAQPKPYNRQDGKIPLELDNYSDPDAAETEQEKHIRQTTARKCLMEYLDEFENILRKLCAAERFTELQSLIQGVATEMGRCSAAVEHNGELHHFGCKVLLEFCDRIVILQSNMEGAPKRVQQGLFSQFFGGEEDKFRALIHDKATVASTKDSIILALSESDESGLGESMFTGDWLIAPDTTSNLSHSYSKVLGLTETYCGKENHPYPTPSLLELKNANSILP
jgi:hypothetical protein